MLIQRQNIAFRGFKVKPEAMPYFKNSLPRVVNSDLNLLSRDPERILMAFKKRMERMANALKKKQAGLDIVMLAKKGVPELKFRNKNNKTIGPSLVLAELVQTKEQQQAELFTLNNSLLNLNSILEHTHNWVEGMFPKMARKPSKILAKNLKLVRKQFSVPEIIIGKRRKAKCPDTLTGVVYKVFGQ